MYLMACLTALLRIDCSLQSSRGLGPCCSARSYGMASQHAFALHIAALIEQNTALPAMAQVVHSEGGG